MNIKNIHKPLTFSLCLLIFHLLFSCSTGIEKTKTITYSKSDKKELAPSPEEIFISSIRPAMLRDWEEGRSFLITDDKAALVFDGMAPLLQNGKVEGTEIQFAGIEERNTPGGTKHAYIIFSDGNHNFAYPTGKPLNEALSSITSLDIPMLIDLPTVNKYRDLLLGKQLWTRTSLSYDADGEKILGRKFIPVKIWEVIPGNSNFHLRLALVDETGQQTFIFMNVPNRGLESRTLPTLFFLNDPRLSHPSVSDENWDLICRGLVKQGMTKEECKLSLGNPDDVNSGHDWNQTIDIWNYKNGSFLQFSDGLLSKFRI